MQEVIAAILYNISIISSQINFLKELSLKDKDVVSFNGYNDLRIEYKSFYKAIINEIVSCVTKSEHNLISIDDEIGKIKSKLIDLSRPSQVALFGNIYQSLDYINKSTNILVRQDYSKIGNVELEQIRQQITAYELEQLY